MDNFKLKLQLFADGKDESEEKEEAIEIPDELSGISPEIAAEIMKEVSESQAEAEKAQEKDEEAEVKEKQADNPPEEKEPEIPEHVPYSKFQEIDSENKQLQAKLKAYESAQQQQITAEKKPDQSSESITSIYMKPEFADAVNNEARRRAQIATGLTDEEVAEFESEYAENTAEKRKWDASVNAQIPLVAVEAKEIVRKQEAAAIEQKHIRDLAYQEYAGLAKTVSGWQDKDAIREYAFGEYFNNLPEIEKMSLKFSYESAESGRGNISDVQIVKYHLNRAAEQYRTKQGASTTNKKLEKIKQAKALPRTDQLNDGGNSPEGTTIADIERMLDDPNVSISKLPPEIRKMLQLM